MNTGTAGEEFVTELAPVAPWDQGPPRINTPEVTGIGVATAVFVPMPTVGKRPIHYAVRGLPDGLRIDTGRGTLEGTIRHGGRHRIVVTASNDQGQQSRELTLVAGGGLALTPPMGWNSWYCWGRHVDDARIRQGASLLVSSGLAAHGYTYANIDDGWQGQRGGPRNALQGNEKFPDMAGLCRHVHDLGLRIGIYSTPWVLSYARGTGGTSGACVRVTWPDRQQGIEVGHYFGEHTHEKEDAWQWAQWGFDFLKYDWYPFEAPETQAMAEALAGCGRDVVYSLSNAAPLDKAEQWAKLSNMWRTTKDMRDTWDKLSAIGFSQDPWTPFAGPGHWNDPDMILPGKVGSGEIRDNALTVDERITQMTLWALLAAPLLISCHLTHLDDFTIRLLCNDEVLAVDQDPLGVQGRCRNESILTDAGQRVRHHCVYAKPLSDGRLAVGLFNRGEVGQEVSVKWSDLGLRGPLEVRNLWGRKDMGVFEDGLTMGVPAHGAQLITAMMSQTR